MQRDVGADTAGEGALEALQRAAYTLSAADARLRGRATRDGSALSFPQARALRALSRSGPLSVVQLAEAAETTGPAMTQLLNRLERDGFVTRRRNTAGDHRVVEVSLTEAGRRRDEERSQFLDDKMRLAFDGLADRELATAVEVLTRLSNLYDSL